jgi:hypothetical protein
MIKWEACENHDRDMKSLSERGLVAVQGVATRPPDTAWRRGIIDKVVKSCPHFPFLPDFLRTCSGKVLHFWIG